MDSGFHFEKLDLVVNIENVLFVLEPSSLERKLSIKFSAGADEFIIDGNFGQITQVFMNLISNAIKFSPVESSISISLARVVPESKIPYIKISISDRGMGIPADALPQLFTRFFRASNVIEGQIPGTGLGLAIAQKIVLLHGGQILVTSELGQGTTFEVHFPEAVSATDTLISSRRHSVLLRSISRIGNSTSIDFESITHEVGGAIGFYTFIDEGKRILEISRNLDSPNLSEAKYKSFRQEVLSLLETAQDRIENEEK
jgi:hypothetical protein